MPIFSQGESKDKLTLLYYSASSGMEMTRDQLYRAMIENECMGYFEFQTSMNELEEDGYIVAIPRAFGQGYRVTVRGEKILEMFGESLPYSYREKLKAYALENAEKMRIETQLVSSMQEIRNGTYHVTLRAQTRDAVELEIGVNMASREMANRVRRNWSNEKNSEQIYEFLLQRLLQGPEGEEQETEPTPDGLEQPQTETD